MKLIKLLLEGKELEQAKEKVMNIINQELTEDKQAATDAILKFMDLIGDDKQKLDAVVNVVGTLAKKNQLTQQAITKFIKSDYGRRLLSDKALTSGEPKRKNAKDLRIDKVEAFEDITDAHISNKATVSVLKSAFTHILNADVPVELKEKFIDDVADPSKLISKDHFLKPNNSGNIRDLIHKDITSNPLFDILLPYLFHSEAKGVGKGEALLIFYGSNSGDSVGKAGDVMLDGTPIEVKNAIKDSSIDSANSSAKMDIDGHNVRFLQSLGLSDDEISAMNTLGGKPGARATQGQKMPFDHPLVKPKLTVDNLSSYFDAIYNAGGKGLDSSNIRQLASDIIASDGSKKEVASVIAPYVFKLYKKAKGFESIVFLKPDGRFVSFVEDIPDDIIVKAAVLTRGGDNQSLPAGYVNLTFK